VYRAYGLSFESTTPLEGIATIEAASPPPDLLLTVEAGETFPPAPDETVYHVSPWVHDASGQPALIVSRGADHDGYGFRYAEGVQFRIDAGGHHITARLAAHSTVADMTTFLTGPVLGFVLRMRGVIALHACAVEVDGRAIVLAGEAAAGKSTTAVTFARLGYRVLTEDVAALVEEGCGMHIHSGCPEAALRPDAVERLYGSVDALPKFSENWDKRRVDLDAVGAFAHGSRPLGAIYLLDNNPDLAARPSVTDVSRRDAMVALLANIYVNYLFHDELRVREVDTVHRLVSTVPVKSATTGGPLTPVGRFCQVVLDDIRAS
jgi:hypothetical protein